MDTVLDARTDLGGHHGVLQPASLWGLPSGKLPSQLNMHHLIICKKVISLLCYNVCLLLEGMFCFCWGAAVSFLAIENSSRMKLVGLALPGYNACPPKPTNISEARATAKDDASSL